MKPDKRRAITGQLNKAVRLCAENGARLTALRQEALRLILSADGPLTAYQLLNQLKETRKNAVPPTVYRTLEFLLENRLIHRIERLNAFIPCTEAEHEHHAVQFLICGQCGAVAEIEDPAVSRALESAAEKQGFRTSAAMVELDGTCASCAAAQH